MNPQQESQEEHESSPVPSSPPDAYEAASKATEEEDYPDYSHFTPQLHPKKKWPRVLGWLLLAVIVLGGLGAGGYWWQKNHKALSKTPPASSQKPAQNATSKSVTQTKSYDSTDLSLSFTYPENWAVADVNSKLTVTSPSMQLTGADGQHQSGQIIVTIQGESAADFSMFKPGSAVAVLASQKVAYASPTSTQRASTYISFLQYAATTAHSALDGIFVTGDSGYQYGQSIPETDVTKVDPDIRVTFTKCANAACSGTLAPLSIDSKMWSDSSLSTPIVNMIKSLQLQ